MIDIKILRESPELVKNSIKNKGIKPPISFSIPLAVINPKELLLPVNLKYSKSTKFVAIKTRLTAKKAIFNRF